ncbi:hypothetical protein, variant 1 [Aphanomyces invadans]|uniref:Cyclic nucleotide-binding domain-containing protein n=1 Tax=Aphanomyces invadans TaxID=157072 RepID=A0A024TNL2_9STRA|nr:hypothetical protein, variant 1 [Aphanomyces invadans]ETV95618.1 hypothetical protein, variant 1 [Aphanomyces invadans]|eukprot:XP_008875811.1 hypothetical protein, variant 1 [Aphanomyces invadans]
MEKVAPKLKGRGRPESKGTERDDVVPPLPIPTVLPPSKFKQRGISFNMWRQAEVIPAVNRVSLQVSAEERKKLEQGLEESANRFMWTPDSPMRLSWDALIAVVTVFFAYRLPYSLAFEADATFQEQPWSIAFNSIANVLYILDVIANFRTGYRSDVEVILDPKKVAINYVKTWFLVDVAGSIPFELFLKTGDSGIERKAVKTSLKYLKIQKLFRLARIIRFVRKHMQFMYAFQLSFLYISVVHWVACLGPSMLSLDVSSFVPFTRYGIFLYISVTALFDLGKMDGFPEDEQIVLAALSVFGFFLVCLVSASITAIFVSQTSRASEYQEKIHSVMSDLKALQVPRELRLAAKNYYEMLWRVKKTSDRYEKFIYEDQDLSPTIRAEIALHIHRRAIAVVPLFKGCTDDCLATVVMRLKTHLYMAHDVIFHKGEPGRSMLIIIRGKVKIIGPDNRTLVAVLKEGSFFGEIGLLQNTTRSCTVVAATFCEMKSLAQADAEDIFSLYPHILERLYRESDRRKRDNSTRNSFCSIKVLDNAHTVSKESIDQIDTDTRFSGSRSGGREPKSHPETKTSLMMNLGPNTKPNWTISEVDGAMRHEPPDSTSFSDKLCRPSVDSVNV